MCSGYPSKTQPIFTIAPVSLTFSQNTFVQLGGEKMALLTSSPTLRRSMSKAATISMSPGRYEPIWRCINPMPVLLTEEPS
jgi:hypothetical protein